MVSADTSAAATESQSSQSHGSSSTRLARTQAAAHDWSGVFASVTNRCLTTHDVIVLDRMLYSRAAGTCCPLEVAVHPFEAAETHSERLT